MGDEDAYLRVYSALAVHNLTGDTLATVPVLAAALADDDAFRAAARAIEHIGPTARDASSALLAALDRNSQAPDLVKAVRAIGDTSARTADALVRALGREPLNDWDTCYPGEITDEQQYRSMVASLLGELAVDDTRPELRAALEHALQDDARHVREAARAALKKLDAARPQ
jgi:hypothetical protein